VAYCDILVVIAFSLCRRLHALA